MLFGKIIIKECPLEKESITEENLKNGKVAVTVYINANETVSVNTKAKHKPNYFMIGNGTMNKHKIYGIDLLQELADSSKAGQFLLLAIKNGINHDNDYNHIVKISAKELSKYAQKLLIEGYKELSLRGLVRRVKQSHYMINPNALIPLDYEQAMKDWDSAEKIKDPS